MLGEVPGAFIWRMSRIGLDERDPWQAVAMRTHGSRHSPRRDAIIVRAGPQHNRWSHQAFQRKVGDLSAVRRAVVKGSVHVGPKVGADGEPLISQETPIGKGISRDAPRGLASPEPHLFRNQRTVEVVLL